MSLAIDISLQAHVLEVGIRRYCANDLAAYMLANVADAEDSNGERFAVLVRNNIPPAVASRLLLAAGYTKPDACSSCDDEVDVRENVVVNLDERRVRHARCAT